MKTKKQVSSAAWHKRLASGYLLGFMFALAAFVIALIPATPLFIKLLLQFPKLEDASHWAGRVEIEGEFRIGARSNTIPRHFIVTPTGRHEFKCDYLGYRVACSNYQLLDGATGEVWYHPIFGALQWRFVIGQGKFKGEIEESPISAFEAYHRKHFFYSRYISKLLIALTVLAVALWQFTRYLHHRAAASSGDATTSNSCEKTSGNDMPRGEAYDDRMDISPSSPCFTDGTDHVGHEHVLGGNRGTAA